jgi:hypothetical protein
MKSHKSIAVLMIVVTGIIAFWLYPGINKANTKKYERVYEDTSGKENSPSTLVSSDTDASDTSKHRIGIKKPEYLKQEIVLEGGVKELEVEMFSRAIHFREELIAEDSLELENPVAQELEISEDSAEIDVVASTEVKRAIE